MNKLQPLLQILHYGETDSDKHTSLQPVLLYGIIYGRKMFVVPAPEVSIRR